MESIVADGVEKRYGDVTALCGVSLAIERGEAFGLIGPNGAGKTTLVRTLTGTTKPTSGTVSVLGSGPQTVDRSRIGLLPQDFRPPDRLTGRELLRYYAGLYEESRCVDDVLEAIGMADAADRRYEDLSGGQQRRVCVGTALVNDPNVLFLDEPTTGIDPAGRRTLWNVLADLADTGTTILLTTHDMVEAETLADRVGLLANGSLVASGSPEALIAEYGGESRVEVTVEEAIDPDALGAVDHRVSVRDGRLLVHDVEPAEIGAVVDALSGAGIDYETLTWTRPSLEDVYLALADTERAGVGGPNRGRSLGVAEGR